MKRRGRIPFNGNDLKLLRRIKSIQSICENRATAAKDVSKAREALDFGLEHLLLRPGLPADRVKPLLDGPDHLLGPSAVRNGLLDHPHHIVGKRHAHVSRVALHLLRVNPGKRLRAGAYLRPRRGLNLGRKVSEGLGRSGMRGWFVLRFLVFGLFLFELWVSAAPAGEWWILTEEGVKRVVDPQRLILFKTWRDPYLGMEFVWVPGGCF